MEPTFLRRVPFALGALYVVVALIATAAYAICAWQVFGFASHVWRLPRELSFAAAFVADLLSLAGLFATYQLRRATRGVQAYAWAVFLGMAGLSIAAAESYATWRFAPDAAKPATLHDARIASAAIVIALALAVHLLILCRNHASLADTAAPARPPVKANTPPPLTVRLAGGIRLAPGAEYADATNMYPHGTFPAPDRSDPYGPLPAPATSPRRRPAPTPRRKTSPATANTPPTTGRRGGRPVDSGAQTRRDKIARAVLAGEVSKVDAAARQGVSVRSIENWCASYEQRQATIARAITPAPDDDPPDPAPTHSLNGAAPAVGAAP